MKKKFKKLLLGLVWFSLKIYLFTFYFLLLLLLLVEYVSELNADFISHLFLFYLLHHYLQQNKENEAKEELKRRAKQLEMQRREMTRRGQTPSSTSGGFSTTPSYLNANAYVPPRSASFSQAEADRQTQLPTARPFKTKGMQLGGGTGKGKKNDGLREALGGLSVEDGLERYEEEEAREQQYLVAQQQQQQQQQQQSQYQQQQQQQQQQYSAPPPQQQAPQQHPVTNRAPLSKDVNPFGAVEELE